MAHASRGREEDRLLFSQYRTRDYEMRAHFGNEPNNSPIRMDTLNRKLAVLCEVKSNHLKSL